MVGNDNATSFLFTGICHSDLFTGETVQGRGKVVSDPRWMGGGRSGPIQGVGSGLMVCSHCTEPGSRPGLLYIVQNCSHCTGTGTRKLANGFCTHFSRPEIHPGDAFYWSRFLCNVNVP